MTCCGSLKADAKEYFRLKQYQDACCCHTAAIQACPRANASELSNLCATLTATQLILVRVPEAIESATKAIELDLMGDSRPPALEFRDMVKRATDMHRKMPNIVLMTITGPIRVTDGQDGAGRLDPTMWVIDLRSRPGRQ
jgi:hypothetical protein